MKKIPLTKLETDIYTEKLENGLEIFVAPKKNVNNIYATFTTKFGSRTNEFIPFGEKDYIKVPEGIAHFLEHKAFEQEDGVDPFTLFSKNGADSNASTDRFKTTYLFAGATNFKQNMNCLLDFVQAPYFTDENVEKEKGIIEQEIEMYKDQPFREGYDRIIYNSFVKNPIRYTVGGSVDSIYKITKEQLYQCYQTFYNPNNMFVVVTGKVKPKEVIEIIKENQQNKKLKKMAEIKVQEYSEPDHVAKEKDEIKMNVTIPKMFLSYKFNIQEITDDFDLNYYFSIYTDLKFGPTSALSERLKQKKIMTTDIDFSLIKVDNHLLIVFDCETENTEQVMNIIKQEFSKNDIKEEEFNRKKKAILAACVYMSDNIYSLNNKITNDIIYFNQVNTDMYNRIKNLEYEKLNDIINHLDFSNYASVIVNPK